MTNEYCECCGRLSEDIMNELENAEPDNTGNIVWEGHKLVESNGKKFYYDNNRLEYCGFCGEKLEENDILTTNESRGEFWGAPCNETTITGYRCSYCGEEETF